MKGLDINKKMNNQMKKPAWRKGQGVINILPILIVEYYSYIKIVYVEFRFLKFFWYVELSFKKRSKY